ncbi:MAG: PAS domain S-box protein [Chloroflexi bacterium]|nr:PAS domain S-box protein [Chloroflexota bacterium]
MQAMLPTDQVNDEKFWLVFEQAAVGIALVRLDGRFLRANPELCKLLGYSEDQLKEMSFQSITYRDDLYAELASLGKVLDGEITNYKMEKRYIHRDGRVVWANLSLSLARDAGGNPLYLVSIIQDISKRKVAEEGLLREHDRYIAICDSVADFVSVQDRRGTLLFASPSCLEIVGYTPDELVSSNLLSYVHPDDRRELSNVYNKTMDGLYNGKLAKYRLRRKDGSYVWLESYTRKINGLPGAEGEILCVSRKDRTQEKEQAKGMSDALDAHDELTRLSNQSATEDYLVGKLTSPRSATFPISCLLVAVNSLETITTSYGYSVGDEVLRRVAAVLSDTCRVEDFVGRYGEDNFLVVLPNTNAGGTIIVGERLIRNVKTAYWSDTPIEEEVTISIGGTSVNHNSGLSLDDLVGILTSQLAQAKEAGRGCLMMNAKESQRQTFSSLEF